MRIGPWDYTPTLWPTLGTIVLVPLLAALGNWQLNRARESDVQHQQVLRRSRGTPLDLATAGSRRLDMKYMTWRRVLLRGHYDPAQQYLLDNQLHEDQFGYDVFTPFVLAGGHTRVLVNRGWLRGFFDRSKIPHWNTPTGEVRLVGLAKTPYRTGMTLGGRQIRKVQPGVYRMETVQLGNIAGAHGWDLLPYVVRLEPPAPPGWVRDWPVIGSRAAKNLGYAFQWFAMALTVVIIYLILNVKRRGRAA